MPRRETKSCQGNTQTVGLYLRLEVVCNSTQIVRLKKPDNGNRTSEASKEAKPKRTEGKRNCYEKDKRIGMRI
jgi:hypothetical protein